MKKSFNILAVLVMAAAIISWSLPPTIENLNQQPVPKKKPATTKTPAVDPIKALYKNGGIVVWEKDGHGLVVAEKDLNPVEEGMTWVEGNAACENLVLNGYSNWRLPTPEECEQMRLNVCSKNIGNLRDPDAKPVPYTYWTSKKIDTWTGTLYAFHNGLTSGYNINASNCCGGKYFRVRAVREF